METSRHYNSAKWTDYLGLLYKFKMNFDSNRDLWTIYKRERGDIRNWVNEGPWPLLPLSFLLDGSRSLWVIWMQPKLLISKCFQMWGHSRWGEGQKDKNTMIAKQRQWLYLQSSVVEISWECFLRNCCILLGDFICNTPLRHNGIFTLIYIFAIHSDHSIWTLDSWNKDWLFLAESRSMARQSIPKIGCRIQMCNFLSHCNKHAETVIIVCRFVVGEILYPQLFFFSRSIFFGSETSISCMDATPGLHATNQKCQV